MDEPPPARGEPRQSSERSDVSCIRGNVLTKALAREGTSNALYGRANPRAWASILSAVPLFSGLGSRDLRRVADQAEVAHVQPGYVIVREGFSAEGFYVLLTGTAAVRRSGEADRPPLARGDYFGELGLLDGAPRTASVVATSEAWLMRPPRSRFLALVDQHASIGRAMAEVLAARLRDMQAASDANK